MDQIERKWMNPKEVADRLGITVRTLNKWIAAGKLTPCRIGRVRRFDQIAVDRWFSKQH